MWPLGHLPCTQLIIVFLGIHGDVSQNIVHYIAKSNGSPPSNERFDYFSNFHKYKS